MGLLFATKFAHNSFISSVSPMAYSSWSWFRCGFCSSRSLFRGLFFFSTCLALDTFIFILFHISDFNSSLRLVPQKLISQDANGGSSSPLPSFAEGVFHDEELFLEDYKEMNNSFKIYVYPHQRTDPFAPSLLPQHFEPQGNYASESFFKKSLIKSHFITNNPNQADFFFLPFSITALRNDVRVSVTGIPNFIRDYIFNVSHEYPYWNRTGGADHFYVACHSVGRCAMDKSSEAKSNIVQVVCSSSYFLPSYISHKDAALPQIWPRKHDPPNLASSNR